MNISCVVCQSSSVAPRAFHYRWRGREWRLYRCADCTHTFVWPHVEGADYRDIYDSDYFDHGGDWAGGVWPEAYWDREESLRREARKVLDWLGEIDTGRLLDVGCAGGVLLDEARARGFEVVGIELNAAMAAEARRRFGLSVVRGRVGSLAPATVGRPFSHVTMMDVLEHLPRPRRAMERLCQWTERGSKLLVRGPIHNTRIGRWKSRLRDLIGWDKRLPGYPLDANQFTPESLERLLRDFGFQIVRTESEPGFLQALGVRVKSDR